MIKHKNNTLLSEKKIYLIFDIYILIYFNTRSNSEKFERKKPENMSIGGGF